VKDRSTKHTLPNIVLIGYRGCGKTTVGTILADKLGNDFIDIDLLIEEKQHCSIAEIFATHGQDFFRDLETEMISSLAASRQTVISVGGGAIERLENRRQIAQLGLVVWLTAAEDTLHRRILADARSASSRPPLSFDQSLDEIRSLLARRNPHYQEIANLEIDSSSLSPENVAELIQTGLRAEGHLT